MHECIPYEHILTKFQLTELPMNTGKHFYFSKP